MSAPSEGHWEQMWLPLWPLASDDLRTGIYRMSRDSALGRRYIEANPQAISNLLVVDIDHPDALLRVVDSRQGWLPNAVVENPANGHAHAVWALREPVTRTEYAKRKPLAFASAIVEGLRRSVDGDAGYSGLITKNPTHIDWHANWFTDHLYQLRELQHYLDADGFMPAPGWKRTRRKHPVGLSRNLDIFESARTWAYPLAGRIRLRNERPTLADSHDLYQAITGHISELNAVYSEPLPLAETNAIATSIHKWITTRFYGWINSRTHNQATFSAIQTQRGRKGGVASGKSRRALHQLIIEEATQL